MGDNVSNNLISKIWNSPTLMTWGNLVSSSMKLIILTPLILVTYSEHYIAFWYLLLTINSLQIVLDFGFYPTFSRIISYAYNGLDEIRDITKGKPKDNDGAPAWAFMERIYGTLNSLYLFLSIFVLIVVLIACYFPVSTIINRVKEADQFVLYLSYVVFVISVVFNFLAKKFDSVIIGTNHVALVNRWNIINNILNSIFSITIVSLGLGIEWLAYNQLFFSILLLIRNYYLENSICDSRFKGFSLFKFDVEIFKWIWTPVWQSGILILASTGLTQSTGFIYSEMSTSAQLTSYLLTLKLVTIVAQFSQAPFYSKIPQFSGLRAKSDLTQLSFLSRAAIFKALMVFVTGVSALFLVGDIVLELIGSNSTLESNSFIILMAFIWFFERHHAMHAQIYVTTNKVPFYKTAIISGIINISLILLLLPQIGVWTFPVSYGVANLAINNWWNVKISLKSINENFISYFYKSGLIPLGILIVMSLISIIFK